MGREMGGFAPHPPLRRLVQPGMPFQWVSLDSQVEAHPADAPQVEEEGVFARTHPLYPRGL